MLDQLDSLVRDVFAASPNFERFLASGAIRHHTKQSVIEATLGASADPLFVNFLLTLNDNDRLNAIRPIWATYRNLYDAKQRRIRVKVRTAAALSAAQEERLKKDLHDAFDLQPILEIRVDPELLGGLVVQIGDIVYDGTVRTRLAQLRNQLMVRSSYEIQSQRDRFSS
jgi:F-type H+-transporting ATPase subunit delta